MEQPAPVIGVLYPGEMGSALGGALRQCGHRVVTTLAGRGERTRILCCQSGLEVLDSLADVVHVADVVFSLVPPGSAREVAACYASCKPAPGVPRRYADLNSVAPPTGVEIGQLLAAAGVEYVDGSVQGAAGYLRERVVVYLSGASAGWVAGLFGTAVRTRVLGSEPGTAKTMRMLVSGVSKGAVALVLEMGLAARKAGLLAELLECYRDAYPGLMSLVDRSLPTYPQHAARRGDEMAEVEQTLHYLGLEPCLVSGARRLIADLGRLELARQHPEKGRTAWLADEVIDEAGAAGLLA